MLFTHSGFNLTSPTYGCVLRNSKRVRTTMQASPLIIPALAW